MKKLLLIFLLLPFVTKAANQYVDSSYTGTSTGTISQPWKAMSSINQAALNAGDSVLFKAPYQYAGNMNITKGGSVGNAIVYTSYGTGRATLIGTGSTITALFYLNGPDYVTFTNFNITDPTLDANDPTRTELAKIQRAFYIDGASNHIITSYMNVDLVGVGVYWVGGNNTMMYCDYGNMRMVEDDPGGVNDYGANPVTIGDGSDNNLVTHCNLHDLWAHSYDFGLDGGAFEMYSLSGSLDNNVFEYNFINDGIGVSEITGNTDGFHFRYNIIINNGSFLNFQNGYTHANTTVINNVFVLTEVSPVGDTKLYVGSPQDLTMTNNLYYMRAGCDVASTGTGITNTYNRYNLGSGSTTGMSAGTGEVSSTTPVWVSMTGDETTWDYHLLFSVPGKPGGTGLNIDYYSVTGSNDYMGVAKYVSTPPPSGNTIKFPIKINGVYYKSWGN